ncbi:glutamate-aspartate carrier protein [Conidiobolus coronatus NRRL 28638]|uniref:Amino acid transporter n=1 Tax=Conidiobolus coronatus (strain ATCC 28846 / CBS 209.66 / NRRL 28638) TaxID=796925 RepID=A0A137PAF1_CONC2|nr:glutamate-aspartate carrier protein [Conidiobolus coronatus NRRL 28638]|eukprot:KXN71999.1 glutamate-aspartate carrier protein [Conidiobolus coronatus NRRL 28638]
MSYISKMFINMVKTLIVPLVFSTLVVGIAGHSDDIKALGMLALKSIVYFEVATTIALIIGMIAVNVIKPGKGIDLSGIVVSQTVLDAQKNSSNVTWHDIITHVVPASFFEAASKNDVLQVVFCAVMFAVALMMVDKKYKPPMIHFLESLSIIMFKVTELVMNFAPIGIMCALAATINAAGPAVLVNLAALIGTLYGSLIIYALVVFLPVLLICRVPLLRTCKAIGQPALIAFTTASSEAALPKAMELMERLGVPKGTVSFVMPTGYSFNLDGTTLYLALASVFCAQAGKIDMPIGQQIVMMLTLMLTSKGVAAVPRASLVILAGTINTFNLPAAAIEVILGVDALMDMGRTAINLTGNCVACVAMSVWEGDFDYDIAFGRKEWVDTALDDAFDVDIEANISREKVVQIDENKFSTEAPRH